VTRRILLAGGGSGGSATPVLAVAQALRRREPSIELLYVGTRDGPEAALAAAQQLRFAGVHAGKLRRYWDARNLTDPLRTIAGVAEAYALAREFRPHLAIGAGGFGAVPPLIAARLVGARTLIHQQDVEPGLANRLLVPFSERITVSLGSSLAHFPRARTLVTGNPVREEILHADADLAFSDSDSDSDSDSELTLERGVPVVVVTGGGTGALALNRLAAAAAPRLVAHAQVVHLTGRGRGVPSQTSSARYQQREFLVKEMPNLLAAATLVVSRAGMGTLTELAALARPSLIVPMPGSHQWANAQAFVRLGAVEVADQTALTPDRLADRILSLLNDEPRRAQLGLALSQSMPRDAADRIAMELLEGQKG
jgi:UDP-N-acetylglucosamine--N-acetylmuramyl-(pentapeptide) pyrophosphoryl-undecaprenol N-acetylglucosamine transferase